MFFKVMTNIIIYFSDEILFCFAVLCSYVRWVLFAETFESIPFPHPSEVTLIKFEKSFFYQLTLQIICGFENIEFILSD